MISNCHECGLPIHQVLDHMGARRWYHMDILKITLQRCVDRGIKPTHKIRPTK